MKNVLFLNFYNVIFFFQSVFLLFKIYLFIKNKESFAKKKVLYYVIVIKTQ